MAPTRTPSATAPASPPRGAAKREWSRRTESASLQLPAALLAQARANSRALDAPAFLAQLAHEVALTRAAELTLAYRSVILVSAGMKKTRRRGVQRLTPRPCVVLVVRRKWQPGRAAASDPQHLPRWLVTYAEHDGERRPFALETDVQDEAGFYGARAHGEGSVWLEPSGGLPWEIGAIACAVEVQHQAGGEVCLLSAQHVFTPQADVTAMQVKGDLPVRPLDGAGARLEAPIVARTLGWGGLLRGDEDPTSASFDVQLAQVLDVARARRIVGARSLSTAEPSVKTLQRLHQLNAGHWMRLVVPQNHPNGLARAPLKAQFDTVLPLPFAIKYLVRRGNLRTTAWIYHEGLLKLQVEGSLFPLAGDSGSAVVVPRDDGDVTLVGLYIGGNEAAAYVIPAWQLFDIRNYWSHPTGASLKPVSL